MKFSLPRLSGPGGGFGGSYESTTICGALENGRGRSNSSSSSTSEETAQSELFHKNLFEQLGNSSCDCDYESSIVDDDKYFDDEETNDSSENDENENEEDEEEKSGKKLRKTNYEQSLDRNSRLFKTSHMSLPLTDTIAQYVENLSADAFFINDLAFIFELSRKRSISPYAIIVALLYLKRLKQKQQQEQKKPKLKQTTSDNNITKTTTTTTNTNTHKKIRIRMKLLEKNKKKPSPKETTTDTEMESESESEQAINTTTTTTEYKTTSNLTTNSDDNISNSDLCLVSILLASKYLTDEGEQNEIYNTDWAEACDRPVEHVNRIERLFLQKIGWDLFVSAEEFRSFSGEITESITRKKVKCQQGQCTYSDLDFLFRNSVQFSPATFLRHALLLSKIILVCTSTLVYITLSSYVAQCQLDSLVTDLLLKPSSTTTNTNTNPSQKSNTELTGNTLGDTSVESSSFDPLLMVANENENTEETPSNNSSGSSSINDLPPPPQLRPQHMVISYSSYSSSFATATTTTNTNTADFARMKKKKKNCHDYGGGGVSGDGVITIVSSSSPSPWLLFQDLGPANVTTAGVTTEAATKIDHFHHYHPLQEKQSNNVLVY